ncbi:hypothetical protein AZ22_4394 [Bordetella bronchiseptica 980-2]|nr:hypothetical protein AZ22_4394 [Bordetella bronchiseptica 980-2]KCV54096.1 hypothetical protein L491_4356 [Bordetella bronchiseptica 3E44]KCV58565.1 hypothetical protein AZ14_4416 [Bordetella bronchiseptica 980]KDB85112.1 hypothetical protein AZ27_4239 [Bordetella bronchiseptica D756]KDB89051.1 hypothetical protein AZ17_2569 [Bordetella bronchiseptica D989]KDD53659.1 hypothetical protein L534_4362 [Bordetella bronchiseptica RB630]
MGLDVVAAVPIRCGERRAPGLPGRRGAGRVMGSSSRP